MYTNDSRQSLLVLSINHAWAIKIDSRLCDFIANPFANANIMFLYDSEVHSSIDPVMFA